MDNHEQSYPQPPERMERCPACGAVDRSCNYGCPVDGAEVVEYVRADQQRGAVSTGHDPESFEAGALAALDHITDERPDLEGVTMRAAEKIGADIESMKGEPSTHWGP